MRLLVLLVAIMLSGCATVQTTEPSEGGDPEIDPADPTEPGAEPEEPPEFAIITGAHWIQVQVSPEGSLTGYKWKLPANAGYADDQDYVLRMTTYDPERVDVEAFALAVFDLRSGQADLTDVAFSSTGRYHDFTDDENWTWDNVGLDSSGYMYGDQAWGGQEIGIVIAARGPTQVVDLMVYVLKSDPWDENGPGYGAQYDDRRTAEDATIPVAQPTGTGTGLAGGYYSRVDWPWADHNTEQRMGDVIVVHDSAPGGVARDSYGLNADFEAGWTVGRGYEGGDGTMGSWSLKGNVHDASYDDNGALANHPEASLASIATGYGIYSFVAEGAGPSSHAFSIDATNTGEETYHFFQALSFGATLDELLGVPAREYYEGWGTVSRWTSALGQLLEP